MKYPIHYPFTFALIAGPVISLLNENRGAVQHDTELYAVLPAHLPDNGPESPGNGPLIRRAVAGSTTSVSSTVTSGDLISLHPR